jgi:hypothetical protein
VTHHSIYFDFEFLNVGNNTEPISLGAVDQNGKEFYVEFEFDHTGITPWILENVMTKLSSTTKPVKQAVGARMFEKWVDSVRGGTVPNFWAYFAAYDWVCLCNLYGGMMGLPRGWPQNCLDLQQRFAGLGYPAEIKAKPPAQAHNALVDAQWNKKFQARMDGYVGAS